MLPTGRFPMGTPGCPPRVRLCKVHVLPVWERVWRKAGLFIPLRKFRFTPMRVFIWRSLFLSPLLGGASSRASTVSALPGLWFPPLLLCLLSPVLLCPSLVSLICLEQGWRFGTYTPAMVITSASSLFPVIYLDFTAGNFCGWGMDLDSRELFLFQMQERFLSFFVS